MQRYKLPVLVLKGLILLPKNDLRLEVDSYFDKEIIEVAQQQENGKIFVIMDLFGVDEYVWKGTRYLLKIPMNNNKLVSCERYWYIKIYNE